MPTKATAHRPSHAAYQPARPSAARRGYGRRWQKYREWFLACNPLCEVCDHAATDVDHIEAVSGPADPLFWQPSNHQALCGDCHKRKTIADDGALARK